MKTILILLCLTGVITLSQAQTDSTKFPPGNSNGNPPSNKYNYNGNTPGSNYNSYNGIPPNSNYNPHSPNTNNYNNNFNYGKSRTDSSNRMRRGDSLLNIPPK